MADQLPSRDQAALKAFDEDYRDRLKVEAAAAVVPVDRTGRVVRNVWGSPHFFVTGCSDDCQVVPDKVAAYFIWGRCPPVAAALGGTDND